MNDHHSPPVEAEPRKPLTSLVERLDPAIGETSGVMGAMLTELIRRTLRGSVVQIDQELHGHVSEKVDSVVSERLPYIEQSAAEVADKTARLAATEIATEEVRALEGRTQESCRTLETKIVEVGQQADQTIATRAQDLVTRLETTEKQVTETTRETARGLTRQIEEAERRANEAASAQINRQVEDLLDRSRKATTLLKERLTQLDTTTAGLGKQLFDEASQRKADQMRLRSEAEQRSATLGQEVQKLETKHQAVEGRLRQALDELRQANQALMARVFELEKPRGLRALWLWFVGLFRGRKPQAAAEKDDEHAES
jgi:hypothetical protein